MSSVRAQRVETNLVVQQEVFERAYTTLLNGLKHLERKDLENLKSAQSESKACRKREEQNLRKSLLAIVMVIQKLRHNIKNAHFVEKHDTEYFKSHLTSIEENLSTFKNLLFEQLQTLQQEERDLQQSIDSLQQHLNASETKNKCGENSFTNMVQERAHSRICSQPNENIHPDIKEFQLYLQNSGGHTGGWDSRDHLLFTRYLQKYRGLHQMTTALLDLMPDKTPEEIAQHETWYHDYLTLKDAHHAALKEWRDEQVSHKHNCGIERNESMPSATITNSKIPSQRDTSVKQKIKAWKERQQKVRQQQLEELKEKKKQEEDSWRKKVEFFENKRKIMAKEREKHQIKVKPEELRESATSPNIPIKHIPMKDFWEQDKLYIQRRQSRIQRFSASPRLRSSSQIVHAERDPARLLRPTAVWRARVKRSLSEDGDRLSQGQQGSLYIVDVPHLAVPKWREGLA